VTTRIKFAKALALVLALVLVATAGCIASGEKLGEKIYDKGVGEDGELDYEAGPSWMNYTEKGCSVCHGENGQGRTVQQGGIKGSAPPITYEALQQKGYDEDEIRRAIINGTAPGGRNLSHYMPRWNMTNEEVDAIVRYLKKLSK